MAGTWESRNGDDLDPDIRRFIDTTSRAYADHPPMAGLTPQEARRVAESVRKPWAKGGPVMGHTEDRQIPTPHGPVGVRIHDPSPGRVKPALIYIHGGGWLLFSLDTHDRVMREYAARADVVVVGVDYALSPEVCFPVALEQIVAVVRWLSLHGASVGVDPTRLAIGGDSAGGNMSAATALLLKSEGVGGLLSALLLNYAVLNVDTDEEYHVRFGGPGYMLETQEMADFWTLYLPEPADRRQPLASPVNGDLAGLPPTFLTIPECDLLTGQSLDMAARLRSAGVPVQANVYEGAAHSFLEAVSISPLADRAFQDASDWLRRTLSSAAAAQESGQ